MARRFGWVLGATALVAVLAACGDDKGTDTATSTTSTTVKVPSSTDETSNTSTTVGDVSSSTEPIPSVSVSVDPDVSLDSVPDTEVVETDPPAQAELPADGPATVGGVDLPAGKVLIAGEQRLAWITDSAVPGAAGVWKRLYDAFPSTGLYPVLLYDDDQPAHWEEEAFFPNQPGELDNVSLEDVLANAAELNFDPPRTFNGLAAASTGPADEAAADALVAQLPDTRILLVEAPDSGASLSFMGWTGNATYDTTEAMSAAVRSWNERYGAVVVAVGPNSLRLAIAKPPTAAETTLLSDELTLLDPDLETGGAPFEITHLGDGLLGQHMWTMWWK